MLTNVCPRQEPGPVVGAKRHATANSASRISAHLLEAIAADATAQCPSSNNSTANDDVTLTNSQTNFVQLITDSTNETSGCTNNCDTLNEKQHKTMLKLQSLDCCLLCSIISSSNLK